MVLTIAHVVCGRGDRRGVGREIARTIRASARRPPTFGYSLPTESDFDARVGRVETLHALPDLLALDLRPRVLQRDGSIEDQSIGTGVRIDGEVAETLELKGRARSGAF